jgi:hypothetical protein
VGAGTWKDIIWPRNVTDSSRYNVSFEYFRRSTFARGIACKFVPSGNSIRHGWRRPRRAFVSVRPPFLMALLTGISLSRWTRLRFSASFEIWISLSSFRSSFLLHLSLPSPTTTLCAPLFPLPLVSLLSVRYAHHHVRSTASPSNNHLSPGWTDLVPHWKCPLDQAPHKLLWCWRTSQHKWTWTSPFQMREAKKQRTYIPPNTSQLVRLRNTLSNVQTGQTLCLELLQECTGSKRKKRNITCGKIQTLRLQRMEPASWSKHKPDLFEGFLCLGSNTIPKKIQD